MDRMNIVITGHVDHGKSTIVGRLLADTHSLPDGKLDQIKAYCARNSKPFEYAFLLDALKDERSQGITIDSARIFFNSKKRSYILIDAPGHTEFLKNMISGASRAAAALLVIDAKEGIRENSKRHALMLSMLNIRQVGVVVNKMDLVDYDEKIFEAICKDFGKFLSSLGVTPVAYVPVSGYQGENLIGESKAMPWYKGQSILEFLDGLKNGFDGTDQPESLALRMYVQDIYKFTAKNDDRRIIAGTIDTGRLQPGDQVVFYPSGKQTTVKSIEAFNSPGPTEAHAGQAVGVTMTEQIYLTRGELMTKAGEIPPEISTRFKASLFWLGKEPLKKDKEYSIKIGAARALATLEEVTRVINSSSLEASANQQHVARSEVAECVFRLQRPLAFDRNESNPLSSRFVIIDGYEISGGGIVREGLRDEQEEIRGKVILRNFKWETGLVAPERRREAYCQTPRMLLISGPRTEIKKSIAKELELKLISTGKIAYYLGMGSLLYGVDSDLKDRLRSRKEHFRRLSEVAHILLDAGLIFIVTATEVTDEDIQILKAGLETDEVEVFWVDAGGAPTLSNATVIPKDTRKALELLEAQLSK